MIKEALARLVERQDLSRAEVAEAMGEIADGGAMTTFEFWPFDRDLEVTYLGGDFARGVLRSGDRALGNQEIAQRCKLPKSTVSRLTSTLTKLGYLRHNMRLGKYQLGSAVLSIGYPLLASMSIRQIARPFMKELADYTNGAVNMGIRDRLSMVFVEACRSGQITTLPDIGTSVPIARCMRR